MCSKLSTVSSYATNSQPPNSPGIARPKQTRRSYYNTRCIVIYCWCPNVTVVSTASLATVVLTAAAVTAATSLHYVVLEHRVRSVRHVGSVEVSEKDAFLKTTAAAVSTAVGLPPGFSRRPRASVARVEGRDGREVTISERSRHQREIVRHGPAQ